MRIPSLAYGGRSLSNPGAGPIPAWVNEESEFTQAVRARRDNCLTAAIEAERESNPFWANVYLDMAVRYDEYLAWYCAAHRSATSDLNAVAFAFRSTDNLAARKRVLLDDIMRGVHDHRRLP